jgi:hypothetical protein
VHTRRVATFLLGSWLAGTLIMMLLQPASLRAPNLVSAAALPPAVRMIQILGPDQAAMLLRHTSAEMARYLLYRWEEVEILIGLALAACLFLGTQRRIFPLAMCGMMFLMLVFEHFRITPELTYRGRETDFPPGNLDIGAVTRNAALQQVFFRVRRSRKENTLDLA